MAKFIAICIVLISVLAISIAQKENTETVVSKYLGECYNGTEDLNTKYKVPIPLTLNVLLDLIRKTETKSDPMDLKMVAVSLLQRFRQDGILEARPYKSSNRAALPYSPSGDQNNKFKIIMKYLIPGIGDRLFKDEIMTLAERCTLHTMLSTSIEKIKRGDEDKVCSKTAKYIRRIRQVSDDVDVFDKSALPASGKVQDPNSQTDTFNSRGFGSSTDDSSCPIEDGVIYTKWGAVSAGNLIAGIAAGCEPQEFDISVLKLEENERIDNVFGSTVAGDVAEAGYFTRGNGQELKLGANGGWNSGRYYLNQIDGEYFTKAEMRGDLDGLILGTEMKKWKDSVRSMKLSQLLDMYYSDRGAFSTDIKACKRQDMYKKYAPTEVLKSQAYAFALALKQIKSVSLSMDSEEIRKAMEETVEKLDRAIPELNDLKCINNNDESKIAATDLTIFLDCSWNYEVIFPALKHILENIDINPYNSNYTIINAKNGEIIVNTTNSILDFYLQFNETTYQYHEKGFDLSNVIHQSEGIFRGKMEKERNKQDGGGKSLLGLFIPYSTNFDPQVKDNIIYKIDNVFRIYLPDLRFLALVRSGNDFENIVKDARDVINLQDSTDLNGITISLSPLLKRIREIPRRIISTKCGSNWVDSGSEKSLNQFIEPGSINIYRLLPNYFFTDGSRKIKIKGSGGTLNVCYSWDNDEPRSRGNNTASKANDNCKKITSDEFAIDVNDRCSGQSYIKDCAPLYVSVEVDPNAKNPGQNDICRDSGCRYTDSVKFTISLENFGCYSSANNIIINSFVLLSMLIISLLYK